MDLTLISNNEVFSFLASRIRAERLQQGHSQAAMAKKSGIALRTYKRIELTGTGSIQNLIAIMRTLGRIRAVEVLFPPPAAKLRPTIVERAKMMAEAAQKKHR